MSNRNFRTPAFFAIVSLFLLLFSALPGRCVEPIVTETLHVSNPFFQVGLNINGCVAELIDLQTKQNQLNDAGIHPGLWELEILSGATRSLLSPTSAKSFRSENLRDREPGLRLTWDKFNIPAAPHLSIVAQVRLQTNAALSEWNIAVENLGNLTLKEVHFPRIGGFQKHQSESLAVPVWLGQRAANPRKLLLGADQKGARLQWDYPGRLSLQCLAFYQQNGPGFYAACDDTAALRKSFAFWGDANGEVNFEMIHYPENLSTSLQRYAPSYAAIVGTFTGDWITAADRYRTWGTNQAWAKESRLQKNFVPKWVLETGMWVWNRGRSEDVLDPSMALQENLGLPVSTFWHWWHGCPYDTGFPEYLPPREGTVSFHRAVTRAQKQDVHAVVYMNQRLWGMTTKSWKEEGAEYFAVKNANGKIQPEVYNVFTKEPCASMCLHTSFWRNKYAGLAVEAFRDLKVDGIYMDQACSSLACYDSHHGHALGGGAYWMDGFRKLSTSIRERCGDERKVVLAGEGCGEAWLPYLDLMLALQIAKERYSSPDDGWEVIPFFSAVYHPYAVLYGNYSSLTMPPYDELWPTEFAPKDPLKLLDRKFSQQFYLEQARAFVWGQQPTIANFLEAQLHERAQETEYMMRLARVRNRTTKYLLRGTFLRPPQLVVPKGILDLSRLSIYAGQKGGVTTSQNEYPLVIGGSWRATDGDIAVALASIADQPLSISFDLPEGLHPSGKIYRTDHAGRTVIGKWNNKNAKVVIEIPPLGAFVIEFCAK
ncbi:MAG: DUF6259 domain-containing protein [Verrucomicrobiota bacterium]